MSLCSRCRSVWMILLLAAIGMSTSARADPQAKGVAPFQRAMKRLAASGPAIPGIIMAVSSPRVGLEWQGAIGSVTQHGAEALRADDAFRIASITKVYVSATAFRAIEEGKFRLYDTVRKLISAETASVLVKGSYEVDKITVAQLLTHTAGLYDFARDKRWGEAIAADPKRRWTRSEQIALAVEWGRKVSEPGTEFHYSDTGYLLLGEIIERSTGLSLPEAARELIGYSHLGLTHTHFENLEPAPPDERRAHQYDGEFDVNEIDPSIDLYGGGGIVTTARDLAHFTRSLLLGEVFKDLATLPTALIRPPVHNPGDYDHSALLETVQLGKRTCWGHSGYWEVVVAYCPDIDLAIAVSTDQNRLGPGAPNPHASLSVVETALGDAIDEWSSNTTRARPKSETIELPGSRVFPESLSSSRDGTLYVGSFAEGGVLRIRPKGQPEQWIGAGSFGSASILGVVVDENSNTLWVCSNDMTSIGIKIRGGGTGSALLGFDLNTGSGKVRAPFQGSHNFCNDIAIAADGAVYVTNSDAPQILKLPPGGRTLRVWFSDASLAPAHSGAGLDGIAFDANGNLYVNRYEAADLYRINVAGGEAGKLTKLRESRKLVRPDGMRALSPGTFLLVEGAGRLDTVDVKGEDAVITTLADGYVTPTSVTSIGDVAWVTESQLDLLPDPARPAQAPQLPFRLVAVVLRK